MGIVFLKHQLEAGAQEENGVCKKDKVKRKRLEIGVIKQFTTCLVAWERPNIKSVPE